jgi:hypothetical protein
MERIEGKLFKSRWISLPGGKPLEIFTKDGIEYIKARPADVIAITTSGMEVALKRRDSVTGANALCSIHKTYRAIRKPRRSCEQCWNAYNERH